MAKIIFGANLKMMCPVPGNSSSLSELENLLEGYKENGAKCDDNREVVIFVPFTHLDFVSTMMQRMGLDISLGSQGVSEHTSGAHTSGISPIWLNELGVEYVLIGHSEVREEYEQIAGSADYYLSRDRINQLFNRQITNALKHGLKVVYCVGETENERNGAMTGEVIQRQIKQGLANLHLEDIEKITIAYEPRWAIGGNKPIPTPAEIESVHREIRDYFPYRGQCIENLMVLYGGSMNAKNVKEIMSIPGVNGGLVGSACLKPEDFAKIVHYQTA